jgi:hypothetical protein
MAARVLQLPAAQAIDRVRHSIPAAVETEQQRLFLSGVFREPADTDTCANDIGNP